MLNFGPKRRFPLRGIEKPNGSESGGGATGSAVEDVSKEYLKKMEELTITKIKSDYRSERVNVFGKMPGKIQPPN